MSKPVLDKLVLRLIVVVVVLCIATTVHACPNCKNTVAQNNNSMALGFAWSIALMLAVPLTIISAWEVAIRRYCRSIRRINS